MARNVFIAGGTGYIGRHLIPVLLQRGHVVRAMVRKGSESKLPPLCIPVPGDPLLKETFAESILPSDTFIQMVGVPHPGPAKARQFRAIDLVSGRASINAAAEAGVQHFVYMSVAQPAPVMKEYVKVRAECEELLRERKLNATILRPWYVVGEGHRWPLIARPVYRLCERIPSMRDTALRLGLVTIEQMISAIVRTVEDPCHGIRTIEVPQIRTMHA